MQANPLKQDAAQPSADQMLRTILQQVLGLSEDRVAAFDSATPLFGALPELDSMAVASLLTEIEDRFAFLIDDEDIDGETFESFGSLLGFIESKLAA